MTSILAVTEEHRPGVFAVTIANKGFGPARIASFSLMLDGKMYSDWSSVFEAALGEPVNTNPFGSVAFEVGTILAPGDSGGLRVGGRQLAAIESAFKDVSVRITYCSIYDDCWQVTYQQGQTEFQGTR